MLARIALALALISGCADTIEPHYLQAGEDPGAAVRALGYDYVEDDSLGFRGATYCVSQVVALSRGSDDETGAHEYIHVQQQLQLGCRKKGDADREAQAYLAIWIYRGCLVHDRPQWFPWGVTIEDMDTELCNEGVSDAE